MSSIRTSFTEWEGGLAHFGTKGMRWGQRRYQNPDGSLTELGKERYGKGGERTARKTARDLNKLDKEHAKAQSRYNAYEAHVKKQYTNAAENAIKTGKTSGVSRDTRRIAANARKYKSLVEANEKLTQNIISRYNERGYSVIAKSAERSVGKDRANKVLATSGNTVIGSVYGTKYKVKNDGLGMFVDKRPGAENGNNSGKKRKF